MRIGLRSDTCGQNVERLKGYAQAVGVTDIWHIPRLEVCCDEHGLMDRLRLQSFKTDLETAGLNLVALTEIVFNDVLAGKHSDALKTIGRTIEACSQVGIDMVFLYFALGEVADQDAAWPNLIGFHERIVELAEKHQVRLAIHGNWLPEHMLYNLASLNRLVTEVHSDYNGVSLCTGCLHLAGDDVNQAIREFGAKDKIFQVHARNTTGRSRAFQEVMLDRGDVDVPGAIQTLQSVGYNGLMYAEHIPKVLDEPYLETSTAWCIGYLKGLLNGVSDAGDQEVKWTD